MKYRPLAVQISNFDFHPEVYIYPTPRTYSQISKFSLENLDVTQDINVYIHIPFCKQICSYCGYLKIVDSKGNLMYQYVDALIKEINLYRDILKNKKIKTLHFGGGTPSSLSPSELEKIMTLLLDINTNILNTADEISIETTPDLVEFDKFSEYKNLGINRVSIGVQTLIDKEIQLCKRTNSPTISINAIEILRRAGISNTVVDLMIGIEGQTIKSFEKTLQTLVESRPETVELYALGLMPHTSLEAKINSIKNIMATKEIYQCYELGRELLLNADYKQDCHNRYVISDKGSFFQEDYIFLGMSLIGIGAGARSYTKNIHYRNNYYPNNHMKSIIEYIRDLHSGILPVKSSIHLNMEEKIRQFAIYNIECLDKKEFIRNFGISFSEKFPLLYSELKGLELVDEDWRRIWLTTKGLNFRDLICENLFSDNVKLAENAYRPK